jgi:hypothetical protein
VATFAHLAYVLERAADIMLGDHSLNPEEALIRAIWGDQPAPPEHGPDVETFYVASRIVEMEERFRYWEETGLDPDATYVSEILPTTARTAARHVAELFHRIDAGPDHPHVEGDDLDKVARLMWAQAYGVVLARRG